MKASILSLCFFIIGLQSSFAQTKAEQEVITLSKKKWDWMADKNFEVTEVYIKESGYWKLGSLSFTKLVTP